MNSKTAKRLRRQAIKDSLEANVPELRQQIYKSLKGSRKRDVRAA